MGKVNKPEGNKHDFLNSTSQQDLLLDPQNEMGAKKEKEIKLSDPAYSQPLY